MRGLLLLLFNVLIFGNIFAEKTYNIVILETMPVNVITSHSQAIQKELNKLSKKKNISMEIEVLKGLGSKELCIDLLKSYNTKKKPDLVLPVATLAAQAAVEVYEGSGIPILFCVVVDPVGSNIIKEVGIPSGSNISGIVYTQQRDVKIEMVLRVLDRKISDPPLNFGVVSTDYPSSVGDFLALREIATNYGNVNFKSRQFPYKKMPENLQELLKDLELNLNDISNEVDYLWEVSGPVGESIEATRILINSGIPLILGNTELSVKEGALMSIITNYNDTALQIVEMFENILGGTEVGTIPITIPRKFELHLNLKTAKALNIRIPSHILMIAGKNIYN